MTTPYPTHRDVAGLRVPIQLVPRIIQAFRASYPGLTDGLDDDAAVRSVLRDFVTSTLSVYESRMAGQMVQEEIAEKQASMETVTSAAFQQARDDAATITDAPDTVIPIEPEPPTTA